MSYSLYLKPTWRAWALETSLVWNSKIILVVQSEAPYWHKGHVERRQNSLRVKSHLNSTLGTANCRKYSVYRVLHVGLPIARLKWCPLTTKIAIKKTFCHWSPGKTGVASRRKSKTWGYFRLCLARACVHLRWIAMTCAHFGRDQIWTQVKASFSPFGHPTQVNASWVTSINLLSANEIEDSLPWNVFFFFFFCHLRILASKLASSFCHPTQVSAHVQLATTCRSIWLRR